jgi:membrane-associated protein
MPDLVDLDALGAAAVYLVVIGFVFVECGLLVGFFLPGDTLLFAGGLVAADAVRGVELGWLMAGVLVAAIAGETVGYLFGALRWWRAGRAA